MATEITAIRLMRQGGISRVPAIKAFCRQRRAAVLSYLPGTKPTKPEEDDIRQAVNFLKKLRDISGTTAAAKAPAASEACFSGAELLANIQQRLAAFKYTRRPELRKFLDHRFSRTLKRAEKNCRRILAEADISLTACLPQAQRLLSPSDFGFHNAVKDDYGRLYFLDFEYFGWDDPVKTMSDFILHPHPAMSLDHRLACIFLKNFLPLFADTWFKIRARAFFPLFCCKWSLILLNEFLDTGRIRRNFATGTPVGREVLAAQLSKAENMINLWSRYERIRGGLA